MKCPSCGLINPSTAQICDCGYSFETRISGKPIDDKTNTVFLRDRIVLPAGGDYVLASLGSRWKGQLLDAAIALVLTFLAVLPFLLMESGDTIRASTALVIYFGYLLLSDGFKGGRSFGKRVMKTAVIDSQDGKPCSYAQSFMRNIMQILGIFDWVFIFWGKRQRLGDMAAGTVVVRVFNVSENGGTSSTRVRHIGPETKSQFGKMYV
jgi:uncharacterized RDD family membrane protein YckC